MFEGEVIPKSFKLEYSKDCLRHQNKVNHDLNEENGVPISNDTMRKENGNR